MKKIPAIYHQEAIKSANNEAKIHGFKIGSSEWKNAYQEYLGDALPRITMGRNPSSKTLRSQGATIFQGKIAKRLQDYAGSNRERAEEKFKQLFGDIIEWYFENTVDKKYQDSNFTEGGNFKEILINRYMRYYMAGIFRSFIKKLFTLDPEKLESFVRNVEDTSTSERIFDKVKSPSAAQKLIKPFIESVESGFDEVLDNVDLTPVPSKQLSFESIIQKNPYKKLNKRQQKKFRKVLREFYADELYDSHGNLVESEKQALAIAFSEARRIK